jgi:hypothetical protein
MNMPRTAKTAGRLAAACLLTGGLLATGAASAGAATVPAHTGAPTAVMAPARGPHGGHGGFRGGGGHWRGGGGHWRGGSGYYYGGGCDPYYYGYYDLDNPTCD